MKFLCATEPILSELEKDVMKFSCATEPILSELEKKIVTYLNYAYHRNFFAFFPTLSTGQIQISGKSILGIGIGAAVSC